MTPKMYGDDYCGLRPDLCLTDKFRSAVGLLKNFNMTFELQGFSHQFVHFAELLRNHPGTNFCLVHGGMLMSDDDATVDAWKAGLSQLEPFPNLWIKCSGLNFFTARCYIDHMRIILDHVLARFDAERCFYGAISRWKSSGLDMLISLGLVKKSPRPGLTTISAPSSMIRLLASIASRSNER